MVVSGSNLLFRGASDDEQGSKKGDERRGKFHGMALLRFCWNLEKVKLIHRLDVRSKKQLYRQLLADLERVEGKMPILSQVAGSRGRAP